MLKIVITGYYCIKHWSNNEPYYHINNKIKIESNIELKQIGIKNFVHCCFYIIMT